MDRDAFKMLVSSALVYGALYLAMVLTVALAIGWHHSQLAIINAVAAAGVSYLCFVAQINGWQAMGVALNVVSVILGLLAGIFLLLALAG